MGFASAWGSLDQLDRLLRQIANTLEHFELAVVELLPILLDEVQHFRVSQFFFLRDFQSLGKLK